MSVLIIQRWSKMVIRLEAQDSHSHSIGAIFRAGDLAYPELTYVYVSEPKPHAPESMNAHRGTAHLEFKDLVLEGSYYTGRGRREIGTIKLIRL